MTQPEEVRAIVVDANTSERLAVRTVRLPPAAAGEATVRVTAISLNRGEVKRATTTMETGAQPGWDFAGVIEQPAEQSTGPRAGTRVVGILPSGAWAERLRVPVTSLATLPDGVTDAQAATLPVAGLTALYALRKGGLLLGQKVLVDGATGGVGHFAVQLAYASGARVYAHVRRENQRASLAKWCNGEVIAGETLDAAKPMGPYHLILDSIGGSALGAALSMLQRGGSCVTLGASEGGSVTFDSAAFFRTTSVSLHGMMLFDEIGRPETAAEGLSLLVGLVSGRILQPEIAVEASWTQIAAVAGKLMDRQFVGKAVLHVS